MKTTIFTGKYSADKYQSKNPIARHLVNRFMSTIVDLLEYTTGFSEVHEIGCGEGQLSGLIYQKGYKVKGTDIREESLEVARNNSLQYGMDIDFILGSIYELEEKDASDIVMCCEVLEHLEKPSLALENLQSITKEYIILSVPREPIWRLMNMARGKYWSGFGNTPDHIQHWSSRSFISLVSNYFDVIEVRRPLPWTILLCKVRK